jgi:hypothetical protein
MGSFEEEGELQARARARDAVRSLRVHVPTARAWRLQVGQRADPGVRHLRRVQAPAAILTRARSSPWAAQPRQDPRAVADKPVVSNGAENSSLCGAAPIPRPNQKFSSCARRSAPFRSTSPPVNSTSRPSQPHRDPARGCRVGCVDSVVDHKTFDLQARPSLRTPQAEFLFDRIGLRAYPGRAVDPARAMGDWRPGSLRSVRRRGF